ncbi:MAG: tetratricopeptide repeat protein, partial [Acidobacteriota bacterium]|nr:tetratricopeptide repeat protein [Acidobacteriota bacterium]
MKRLVWCGLLLAYFGVALFCAQEQSAFAAISAALRASQYETARQLADAALAKNERDPRLFTLKAIALSKLGNTREAVTNYQRALALSPEYVPALEGVAELEYRTGSETALTAVDKLLRARPADETAHAMRSYIAWKRHDCPTAVEHFAAAQRVISGEPAALEEYGACLIRLNRSGEAVPVYERLHRLEPEQHNPVYALAAAQILSEQYAEAIRTVQPLMEQSDAEALNLASQAYEREGDTPHAVSSLREAIVHAPDRADLYLEFSALCFEHNSFGVGVDMLSAGLTRLPSAAKLYLARGVLLAQMGQYDKADRDFAQAQILDPRETGGMDAQALAEFQADHLEAALSRVQADLRQAPGNAFLHYLLAEILVRRGAQPNSPEFSRAIEAASAAVRLKPDFTLARDVLSRLYLESGNTKASIEQCRLALASDPSDQV